MYSIDINLLRERSEYQTGSQSAFADEATAAPVKYSKIPMFIGIGAAALTLLTTASGWFWLGQQTTQLESKQKDLDQKLGSLQAQDRRLVELNGQVTQISDETQSLASVFNQVQPWSAVLQDLRESIPQGVQIGSVSQSEIKAAGVPAAPVAPTAPKGGLVSKISTVPNPEAKLAPSPAPAAGTPTSAPVIPATGSAPTGSAPALPAEISTTKLDIIGTAKSFEEVNNFILTLKQSAFFNPDETQLLSAGLMAAVRVEPAKTATTTASTAIVKPPRLELPKMVEYKIQTSLKRIPAADLIRELERKGAVGLVTRLKSLQQQQPLKP